MNDKASIEAVFEKRGPFDAVIHFGALKSVGESWKMPLRYYQNNLTGTFNLLEVMNAHNCKKISKSFLLIIHVTSFLFFCYCLWC